MKSLLVSLAIALAPSFALADAIRFQAKDGWNLEQTMQALLAGVDCAGGQVVERIDYTSAVETGKAEVLVFSPNIETTALKSDPIASLYLPLRVLAHEDTDGKVWISYDNPGAANELFKNVDPETDTEFFRHLNNTFKKLETYAQGG